MDGTAKESDALTVAETLQEESDSFGHFRRLLVEYGTATIGEFDVGRLRWIASIVGIDDIVLVWRCCSGDIEERASRNAPCLRCSSIEKAAYCKLFADFVLPMVVLGRSMRIGVRLERKKT